MILSIYDFREQHRQSQRHVRDFEDIILDIWAQARTDEELSAAMADLGQALLQARAGYQEIKAYDDALFGEDFSAE